MNFDEINFDLTSNDEFSVNDDHIQICLSEFVENEVLRFSFRFLSLTTGT